MLKRVYDFIILFKEYAVLSALLMISLILMALGDNTQIRHIRSVVTVVYGVVQDQLSFIPRYLALRSESDMLRRMNIDLADEVSRLRDARIENSQLRNLLGLKESLRYPLIAGKVVGKNLTLLRNTVTLNVSYGVTLHGTYGQGDNPAPVLRWNSIFGHIEQWCMIH